MLSIEEIPKICYTQDAQTDISRGLKHESLTRI